jgi:hypothetical protein
LLSVPAGPGELLSPADSRARLRGLVQWNDGERALVARVLGDALARTARRWRTGERMDACIAALTGPDVRAWPAEDAPAALRDAAWTPLVADAPARVSWACARAPHEALLAAMFDASRRPPNASGEPSIAEELATECWNEQLAALRAALAEATPADAAAAPPDGDTLWRRWSGAVVVDLPWFDARMHLLVDGASVASLVKAGGVRRSPAPRRSDAAVMPVLGALAHAGVRLEVRCGGASIDLGSLVSLRVGDVLRLDHRLDEPVHVVAPAEPADAAPLCRGWLGRADAHLCIELARPPAPTR